MNLLDKNMTGNLFLFALRAFKRILLFRDMAFASFENLGSIRV